MSNPLKFALIGLALIPLSATGAESCLHNDKSFRCVKVLRVYDGDTLFVDIPGTHALIGKNVGVRVRGLDTAEISTKNPCEKRAADATKKLVADLTLPAKRVDLVNVDRDKYFRILADVLVDGKSLSEAVLQKGLAYRYAGARKKKIDWCAVLKGKPAR